MQGEKDQDEEGGRDGEATADEEEGEQTEERGSSKTGTECMLCQAALLCSLSCSRRGILKPTQEEEEREGENKGEEDEA